VQSSSVLIRADHIALRSAYNDTTAVTSESVRDVVNCNKVNKVISDFSSSYTAPTALGIRQQFEQIRANVFLFNVFKRCFNFTTFFTFLTFFNFL